MNEITYEPPRFLTPKNVVYWSPTAQQLQTDGIKQGKAIITKAKKFNELGLVKYNSESKDWSILPIPGYNKTTYTVFGTQGHFVCNCQFYNTVSKHWEHPTCSHIQAVKFWLEIKRYNGGKDVRP